MKTAMNVALIFAGGTGTRMHSKDKPKQFLNVYGKPIIIHTIEHFEKHPEIDAIVVACNSEWIAYFEECLKQFGITKVQKVVPGGMTGQESIRNGLRAIKDLYSENNNIIVLIHDGVRPMINEETITRNIDSVKKYGNAITVANVVETVIKTDKNKCVEKVYDREDCRLARAPQSFYLQDIWDAHCRLIDEGDPMVTDSAMLMSRYGAVLHTVEGPSENIKVTTPIDFYVLQAYMQAKEASQLDNL